VFDAPNVGRDFDPLADCPALATDPAVAAAVAAKQARDDAAAATVAASYPVLPAMSYVDGGMHPRFREILERDGARKLAKLTSERAPVSRPEAALADPYVPGLVPPPLDPTLTGSVAATAAVVPAIAAGQ